jgi:hypothetical protein
VFQEIRCDLPCANSLQAYGEECVQDVHGNLTVIPDGSSEGRLRARFQELLVFSIIRCGLYPSCFQGMG